MRQTNHEGEMLDWLNEAADYGVPVVLNAGAWTHYPLAIWDACAQLGAPLVEVHISDLKQRAEEFRHTSVVEPHAVETIAARASTATATHWRSSPTPNPETPYSFFPSPYADLLAIMRGRPGRTDEAISRGTASSARVAESAG